MKNKRKIDRNPYARSSVRTGKGIPGTFWVVLEPFYNCTLEDICIRLNWRDFMLAIRYRRNNFNVTFNDHNVYGIYKTKVAAERVATDIMQQKDLEHAVRDIARLVGLNF